MEIDREIVVRAPQAPSQADIRQHPRDSASPRRDDDFVEMRIAGDDRSGRGFDQVGEVRVGKLPAQSGHGRRREDHVADLPQTHKEDSIELVGW